MPPVETLADQLFYSTVHITVTDSSGVAWFGTGFFLEYPLEGGGKTHLVVTNRHVLQGAVRIGLRVVREVDGAPVHASSEHTFVEDPSFPLSNWWVGHEDPEVDVAVLAGTPFLNAMQAAGNPPFFRTFPPQFLLTQEQAETLDSIEQVLFVGYPNGLYDPHSYLPIARRGQTATPIHNDYRGKPSFLIDASVFQGSSGSPVLLVDSGTYLTRDGTVNFGQRFHVIGVVAAVHTRQVRGSIELIADTPTATPISVHDEGLNLGIVYKASAIQECVDALAAKIGVTLASGGPVPAPETLV